MIVHFAKSLDRPVDIFGIRGKWLTVFLVLAGLSVVLALIVGSMASSGVGISIAIVLVIASFLFCMVFQGRVSSRQLEKFKASSKTIPYVRRNESLVRILTVDRGFTERKDAAGAETNINTD